MPTRSPWLWRLIWIPSVLCLPFALFFTYEAVYLGLFASEEFISNYHFGAEPMLHYGGWAYQSKHTYVLSLAVTGSLLFGATVALSAAAWWRARKPLLLGVALLAFVIGFTAWARAAG